MPQGLLPALPRPALPHAHVPRPSTLQRNLLLDLSSAVGLGTTMAVVGVLLPSAARREGLDSIGLAALAALPFLASMLSLLAGRIGPHTPGRLAVVRAAGSAALLLVLIAPHPLLIAVATFAFWTAFALGVPLQQRLWATMYPSQLRGRLLGIVGTGRFAAGSLALLACSVAAAASGWVTIIAVVAAVGAVAALATSRLAVPPSATDRGFGARDALRAITRRPMIRRITVAQLTFGGGLVATPALVAMVHIDRLGLGIEDIAFAGLVGYATTTASFALWGRIASRVGALVTISTGATLGALAIGVFALAPDLARVILATALLGAAGAAVDVSWPLLLADHAADDEQAVVAAGINAVMGLRGLVTPFLVMLPIHLGIMDATGGLLLCTFATAAGAAIYLRLACPWRRPLGAVLTRLVQPARRAGLRMATAASTTLRATGRRSAAAVAGLVGPGRSVRHWSPVRARMPSSSSSGWPVILRRRLMRSTIAGWVLKRPLALLSSFFTGLTT